MLKMIVPCAAACVFGAAVFAAEPVPDALMGQWTVEIIGYPVKGDTPPPSMEINADGAYAGFSGCNRYSGTSRLEGGKIVFAPPAVTKMMCAPAAMEQEQRLLGLLNGGLIWKADGPRGIVLSAETQAVARLMPAFRQVDVTIRVPGADDVQREMLRYSCGEQIVTAEYINAGTVSLAILKIGEDFVVASNVMSGSGAKYAGGQYIWWTKDDGATLYDLFKGEETAGVACLSAK